MATRRQRTFELQRRQVLQMVLDVRKGMIAKDVPITPLIDPSLLNTQVRPGLPA